MPVGYGQLGCSGFIVSDKDGCFVSRKTIAYLDYGEEAFRFVEKILDDLVPPMIEAPSSVDMGRTQVSDETRRNQNGAVINKVSNKSEVFLQNSVPKFKMGKWRDLISH